MKTMAIPMGPSVAPPPVVTTTTSPAGLVAQARHDVARIIREVAANETDARVAARLYEVAARIAQELCEVEGRLAMPNAQEERPADYPWNKIGARRPATDVKTDVK